jgi:hypothetical protein
MTLRRLIAIGMAAGFAAAYASSTRSLHAADAHIRGVVMGARGPEAGVWVIAETSDLPTSFRKIVVTDDSGRFLLPELPQATYQVWVRGYGLIDSAKTTTQPGTEMQLAAGRPATPQEAAQIYPASYWYSLLNIPSPSEFPGSPKDGLASDLPSQLHYVDRLKDRCTLCHQLGNKITRELPGLAGKADSPTALWVNRLRPAGMTNELNFLGHGRTARVFADWTERIRAGELPADVPSRPQGRERSVVLTMWGWGSAQAGIHDSIGTDKRNPRLNPNGLVFGTGGAGLLILDPLAHRAKRLPLPGRGTDAGRSGHNPMMDERGRVWLTQQFRPPDNPGWCKEGSDNAFARSFPLPQNINDTRQLSYYDPQTETFVMIDTCFSTHHLQFDDDDERTLWFSGSDQVIGWVSTKKYDASKDERASQGWCPTVVDTNGDGKITRPWNEPTVSRANITTLTGKPFDPALDTQFTGFAYGIVPSPVDAAVWVARRQPTPGSIVRLERGANPPETCKAEVYEPPFQQRHLDPSQWGYGPRGIDVDRHGVIWTALAGSGQLASFDRRKCKVRGGPTASGQQCPEGWTLHPVPGPKLKGVMGSPSADYQYYNWVDQFGTLGLGENVPMSTGTNSDSILVLDPKTREWLVMRVPYPLGFYSRGLNGRIDDPQAGWKGRGVWASYDTGALHHIEGGRGTTSEVVRFQLRPHPLAE